jgi:hypothetical protein
MTDARWESAAEPFGMLQWLRRQGRLARSKWGRRAMRLFAVACCRRVWDLLEEGPFRAAVESAERYAEGRASAEELDAAARAAESARRRRLVTGGWGSSGAQCAEHAAFAAATTANTWPLLVPFRWSPWTVLEEVTRSAAWAAGGGVVYDTVEGRWLPINRGAHAEEESCQAELLRDLFGDVGRKVRWEPGWLAWGGGAVASLARVIDEEGRWEDLPVLGDALEEAGCADEEILGHCRSGKVHARGCWVVDGLRGKR